MKQYHLSSTGYEVAIFCTAFIVAIAIGAGTAFLQHQGSSLEANLSSPYKTEKDDNIHGTFTVQDKSLISDGIDAACLDRAQNKMSCPDGMQPRTAKPLTCVENGSDFRPIGETSFRVEYSCECKLRCEDIQHAQSNSNQNPIVDPDECKDKKADALEFFPWDSGITKTLKGAYKDGDFGTVNKGLLDYDDPDTLTKAEREAWFKLKDKCENSIRQLPDESTIAPCDKNCIDSGVDWKLAGMESTTFGYQVRRVEHYSIVTILITDAQCAPTRICTPTLVPEEKTYDPVCCVDGGAFDVCYKGDSIPSATSVDREKYDDNAKTILDTDPKQFWCVYVNSSGDTSSSASDASVTKRYFTSKDVQSRLEGTESENPCDVCTQSTSESESDSDSDDSGDTEDEEDDNGGSNEGPLDDTIIGACRYDGQCGRMTQQACSVFNGAWSDGAC